MSFKPVTSQVNFVELEQEMLQWWSDEKIIEKYLHRNDNAKTKFSFLDGPITANNPMGVHHAWGRTYKDVFQRYHNLLGHAQRFQNGFDEQGLWVEVEVEKELGLHSKKDIEELVPGDTFASLAKFITLCQERVAKYSAVQTEQSKRLGYFMDWENSYHTSSPNNNYAIWNFLKICDRKGWLYKGQDSVPWCPRCGTAISQMEILTEDYKEVAHESIFFKLPIIGDGVEGSLLVWTTTPWTIPANIAVAVNPEFSYVKVNTDKGQVWVAKEAAERLGFSEVLEVKKGSELIGWTYNAPFDSLPVALEARKNKPNSFHIVVEAKDLVVEGEGTGLVHIAPGAGSEDYKLSKTHDLPVIAPIDESANYFDDFGFLSGQNAKKHPELIIEFLQTEQDGRFLFKTERYKHRYPICWRCKTELVWRVVDEWYIAVDRIDPEDEQGRTYRQQMIDIAKTITWIPGFGLARELDWLNNLGDWLISKKRYWGLALPIYEDIDGSFVVIGSLEELKELAVEGLDVLDGHTPHRPWIDAVKIKSPKTGAILSRIPDVGNPWLDAGIVPISTMPEDWRPADFITESFPGQFKNWFYALIAMSTVMTGEKPFNTVLGFATVRDEKGQEMHKSKGNSIEFNQAAEQVGAESMRWQYVTGNPENNLNFGFRPAQEIQRRFFLIWWNVYNFFITYAVLDGWQANKNNQESVANRQNILDQWIISRLSEVVSTVTAGLNAYDAMSGSRAIELFVINDLSQWYIRRSRDRVGPTATNQDDKNQCYATLYEVLITLTKISAPFLPFLTESMFKNLSDNKSVHLSDWPNPGVRNSKVDKQMLLARQIVEIGHAVRAEQKLKLKQPLLSATYFTEVKLPVEVEELMRAELNVLQIHHQSSSELKVEYDVSMTDELRDMGDAREIVRSIQAARKQLGCSLDAKIKVELPSWPQSQTDEIKRQTLAVELIKGEVLNVEVKD